MPTLPPGSPIGSSPWRARSCDLDLAEDATQQALLSIWQDLPQLRDPARFDAWSYRLLVRACYAEGRKQRRWAPNLRLLPADESTQGDSTQGDGMSSVVDRDQLEGGFRRQSHSKNPDLDSVDPTNVLFRSGQVNVVYILDVDDARVVINTWHMPAASEANLAELEAVLDLIRIEP